jgi:hypothetical protein
MALNCEPDDQGIAVLFPLSVEDSIIIIIIIIII